jgi:hypothetical protein
MFTLCTNLQEAPELPATTLASGCYSSMFSSCTSLSYIKMLATDISATECLWFWVNNVAATGTFVKDYRLTSIPINSPHGIPTGWTIEEVNRDYSQEYLTIESLADNNTIKFTKSSSSTEAKTIYWSSDKTTWNSVSSADSDTTLKTLSNNEKIYIKGSNNNYASSTSAYNYFRSNAEFNISGNIMSLIYGDNFIGQTTLPSDSYNFYQIFNSSKAVDASNLILPATTLAENCYMSMFYGCTSLTTAPELPATTLQPNCYTQMFYNCTSLTTAPELPATTLVNSCYGYMFHGCTSLTTAPQLPATTLQPNCYGQMFSGCTSLTTAPELPATTLANQCYYGMFSACASLTTAPELPATTLAAYCYGQMFSRCTSLTAAPALPATTLTDRCYYQMFDTCTSLTAVPELPATTLANQCYRQMFYDCTSLNYIKCLATDISASRCLNKWVSNVASTGTFVKSSSMTSFPEGASGIPSGWTVVDI